MTLQNLQTLNPLSRRGQGKKPQKNKPDRVKDSPLNSVVKRVGARRGPAGDIDWGWEAFKGDPMRGL